MKLARYFWLPFFAASLAACTTDTGPSAGEVALPVGAAPINVEQASQQFFRDNPGAKAAALLNAKGKGFEFYENGGAVFVSFRAISNLRIGTEVASMQDSEICLKEQDGWSGACMDIYALPDGGYFLEGTYGNGYTFAEAVTLAPIF